jgi:hypothetical protein
MSMEGIEGLWLLMAAIGGAIMPVAMYGGRSQGRAIVRVICGALIAVFLAPALEKKYLPDADLDIQAAVSFLVGCFGLNATILAQKILDQYGEAAAGRLLGGIFKGVGK